MSIPKRANHPVARPPKPEAPSPAEMRALKLRVEQLVDKISALILEKPDYAQKAAVILARWLQR